MTLSNKILIGFFGAAFLYLTAVFAEVRMRGTPNNINDSNSIAETVEITGVSYLVLRDIDYRINVIGSDQSRLEVRSIAGDLLNKLKHNISGDTLTLSELRSEDRRAVRISVFVPKAALRGVMVKSAEANIKGFESDLFNITQEGGQVRMSDNRLGKIYLDASGKSNLDISDTDLDTLAAAIDGSNVSISSPFRLLKGSMRNNSFLHMSDVDELQFMKDESSKLNLYH